jgi:hypothetical protein
LAVQICGEHYLPYAEQAWNPASRTRRYGGPRHGASWVWSGLICCPQTRTLLAALPRAGAAELLREHFPYEEQEA